MKERLSAIFENDDEAEQIWLKLGVPSSRIYRFDASDNWWGPAGTEGPCGPCSEIHLYRGDMAAIPADGDPSLGTTWGPNIHDDFIELYNLVFTQYYRDLEGNDTPLPKNNIDTGMDSNGQSAPYRASSLPTRPTYFCRS